MNSGSFFFVEIRPDNVFIQARRDGIGVDVGDETPLIFLIGKGFDGVG